MNGMNHFQYILTDLSLLEHSMDILTQGGLEHVYTLEDSSIDGMIVGGFAEKTFDTPHYLTLMRCDEAEIDWNTQWKQFSPYVTLEGDISCSLSAFGGPDTMLKLFPGAGFGDLSHPTTQLMLQLMQEIELSFVVDVGCGSGVLSCAAALLGAKKVYGYDIEASAVRHAHKNVLLNSVQRQVKIGSDPLPHVKQATILLNMTLEEQKVATSCFSASDCSWVVSGIHDENMAAFQSFIRTLSLSIEKQMAQDNWNAFILLSN